MGRGGVESGIDTMTTKHSVCTESVAGQRCGERGHPGAETTLLGIDAAAEYLGISAGTLRNWLSMKRIAYVKIGRLTKVSKAALEAYIAAHTVHAIHEDGHR